MPSAPSTRDGIGHELGDLAQREMRERDQIRNAIYRDPYVRVSAERRAADLTPARRTGPALIREQAEAGWLAAAILAECKAQQRATERDPYRPTRSGPDHGLGMSLRPR